MESLTALGTALGARLVERGQTLAVPGASAYYVGLRGYPEDYFRGVYAGEQK
jgi:hypothetical protein